MIENTLVKSAVYEGNGTKTEFDISFNYKDTTTIVPYLYNKKTNVLTKINNTLYSITQDGEKIIYPVTETEATPKLQVGEHLVILRETDLKQLEDSTNKSFKSADIERALDKLTRITQELADASNRSIKYNAAQTVGELDAQKYIDNLNLVLKLAKKAEEDAKASAENAKQSELEALEQASIATASAVTAGEYANDAQQSANAAETTKVQTQAYAENVITGLQAKQNKLVAGNNITIINDVISAQTAFDVACDNVTAEINAEGKISVIGQKEKNHNSPIADWQGTEAEWRAGREDGSISDTDRCYVTDDYEAEVAIETLEGVLREEFEVRLNGKQDAGDYATVSQLNELAAQKQDVGTYVLAADVPALAAPAVPANISAFINDSGYLTQHQSLEDYATIDYVDGELEGKQDSGDYALNSALTTKANTSLDNVTDEGVQNITNRVISQISSSSFPDYSQAVDRSWNTQYTENVNGWVMVGIMAYNSQAWFNIGGLTINLGGYDNNDGHGDSLMIPVPKNTTYSATGSAARVVIYKFIPCIQ